MNTKLINGIIIEPEILSEFKIDWKNYVPSNGWDFQKFYREAGRSGLLAAKATVLRRKDELASAKVSMVDLRKKIDAFASLTLVSSDSFASRVLGDEIVAKMTDCIGIADEMMRKANDYAPDPDEIKSIDADISLIDAIVSFFDNDLALDMILFAISSVDRRYRTKLFRQAMKHLQAVEDAMPRIDNSPSAIKKFMMEMLQDGYDNLKKIYPTLSFGMRRQKKALDKLGQSFWDKYTFDGTEFRQAKKEVA